MTTTYIIRLIPTAQEGPERAPRYLVPPWCQKGTPKGWGTPDEALKAMRELFGQEGEESVHIDGWEPQLMKLTLEPIPWP